MSEMTIKQRVARMIEKECQRNSLRELCEYWDVTIEDFYEFILAGVGGKQNA